MDMCRDLEESETDHYMLPLRNIQHNFRFEGEIYYFSFDLYKEETSMKKKSNRIIHFSTIDVFLGRDGIKIFHHIASVYHH